MNFFYALCLSAVAEDPDAQLQRSFEREFAYVQAEKRTLENQIKISQGSNATQSSSREQKILPLEGELAASKSQLLGQNERFLSLEKEVSSVQDIDSSFQSTLSQAAESLEMTLGNATSTEQFTALFKTMVSAIDEGRTFQREAGIFYNEDGSEINGELLHIGQTATFGKSTEFTGALLPIGEGKFKILTGVGAETASALFDGKNLLKPSSSSPKGCAKASPFHKTAASKKPSMLVG